MRLLEAGNNVSAPAAEHSLQQCGRVGITMPRAGLGACSVSGLPRRGLKRDMGDFRWGIDPDRRTSRAQPPIYVKVRIINLE
jgi:hypothetical protein